VICVWCDDPRVGSDSVRTCPVCLPPGAISWLIENGRQLDLFSDPELLLVPEEIVPQVDRSGSVSASVAVAGILPGYKTQGLCSCDLPF